MNQPFGSLDYVEVISFNPLIVASMNESRMAADYDERIMSFNPLIVASMNESCKRLRRAASESVSIRLSSRQ